jgi:hypothetical protein
MDVSISSQAYIEKQLGAHGVASLDMLPAHVRKEIRLGAKKIARQDVFGIDHKTDRNGNPIEQGVGAKGNQTQQSIDAYIKNNTERSPNGPEPNFEETLARMRKDLAESEARRRAEQSTIDDDED